MSLDFFHFVSHLFPLSLEVVQPVKTGFRWTSLTRQVLHQHPFQLISDRLSDKCNKKKQPISLPLINIIHLKSTRIR